MVQNSEISVDPTSSEITLEKALQALQSNRDIYEQELLTLKSLNETISKDNESRRSASLQYDLLEKLLQQRENLEEELENLKQKCDELQNLLDRERTVNAIAWKFIDMLDESVDGNSGMEPVMDFSKIKLSCKAKNGSAEKHAMALEHLYHKIKNKEEAALLGNKICLKFFWICLKLVILLHAFSCFCSAFLKHNSDIAPT